MANKLVIISDTHAHAYPDSPTSESGANMRLLDIVSCLDKALALAVEHGADLLHAGDVCHNRKGVLPEVLHALGDWHGRCRAAKVPVHYLTGNHDLSIGGDGSSSVQGFAGTVTTYTKVSVSEIAGVRIGWLPYTEDPEEVRAATKKLAKDKCTVLVAHLGLGDPRYANCVPSDYEAPGRINVDDLRPDDFAQVFLGHYHKYQCLTKSVRYVGSPLQLSFSEVGHDKFILVYDTRKNKVECVANDWSPRFHKLSAEDATAAMAKKNISKRDPVWVTGVQPDDVAGFKEFGEKRGMAVRVEKARRDVVKVRIEGSAPQAAILQQYVKATAPETVNVTARVEVGLALIRQEIPT